MTYLYAVAIDDSQRVDGPRNGNGKIPTNARQTMVRVVSRLFPCRGRCALKRSACAKASIFQQNRVDRVLLRKLPARQELCVPRTDRNAFEYSNRMSQSIIGETFRFQAVERSLISRGACNFIRLMATFLTFGTRMNNTNNQVFF